jgi:hypothetical protein
MASSPSLLFKSSHNGSRDGHKPRSRPAAAVKSSQAKPDADAPDASSIGRHRTPPFYIRWLLALRR